MEMTDISVDGVTTWENEEFAKEVNRVRNLMQYLDQAECVKHLVSEGVTVDRAFLLVQASAI